MEEVLGAEGDAGIEQGPRVLEPLLERGQAGLVLVHGHAGLPEEQAEHGQGSQSLERGPAVEILEIKPSQVNPQ